MAYFLVSYSIEELFAMSNTGILQFAKYKFFRTFDDFKIESRKEPYFISVVEVNYDIDERQGSSIVLFQSINSSREVESLPIPMTKVVGFYERTSNTTFKLNSYFKAKLLLNEIDSNSTNEQQLAILKKVMTKYDNISTEQQRQQIYHEITVRLHELYAFEYHQYGEEVILAIWFGLRNEIAKENSKSHLALAHMFITRNADSNPLTCFEHPRQFWQFILILLRYAPHSPERESFVAQAIQGILSNEWIPNSWKSLDQLIQKKALVAHDVLVTIIRKVLKEVDKELDRINSDWKYGEKRRKWLADGKMEFQATQLSLINAEKRLRTLITTPGSAVEQHNLQTIMSEKKQFLIELNEEMEILKAELEGCSESYSSIHNEQRKYSALNQQLRHYLRSPYNATTTKNIVNLACVKKKLNEVLGTDSIAFYEDYLCLSSESKTSALNPKEVERQLIATVDNYFMAQYEDLHAKVAWDQDILKLLTEINYILDLKIQLAKLHKSSHELEELTQQQLEYKTLFSTLNDTFNNTQQILAQVDQQMKKKPDASLVHTETEEQRELRAKLVNMYDSLIPFKAAHELALEQYARAERERNIIQDAKKIMSKEVDFRVEGYRIATPNNKAALLDNVKAKIKSLNNLTAQAELFEDMMDCIDAKEHSGRDLSNILYLNWHKNPKLDAAFGKHYTRSYLQTLGDIRQNALRILKQLVAAEDEPTEKVKLLEWALQQRLFTQRRSNYATIKTNVATFFHLPCRMTTTEREIRQLLESIRLQAIEGNVGNTVKM